MNTLLILAPIAGVGIGLAAAAGVTLRETDRRIHFVSSKNLKKELDKFDIEIEDTEHCAQCGIEIDPEDVGAVVKDNGDYQFVCKKPTCLDTYDVE